jgi:tRNA-splicing ligase RtcB
MMDQAMKDYGITVIDRQLACVPVGSPEGRHYLQSMAAAANFAFANRQMMTHQVREGFRKVLGKGDIRVVYDVCHNIAKLEEHEVQRRRMKVLVHRKGATRALPPGHSLLPEGLRGAGQPVLIPGSMGTSSYVLVGTEQAMKETFGSSCHGAGRAMSRTQAKRESTEGGVRKELKSKGILVRCDSKSGLTEEKPDAYKDVSQVVNVVEGAGIARKVAKLVPMAVMKG